jgi:hypothetical protein
LQGVEAEAAAARFGRRRLRRGLPAGETEPPETEEGEAFIAKARFGQIAEPGRVGKAEKVNLSPALHVPKISQFF